MVLNRIAGVSVEKTRGSMTLSIGSRLSNMSLIIQAYILHKVALQFLVESRDTKNKKYRLSIKYYF